MAETMLFHIIVDNFHRTFTIDGPDGPNPERGRGASRDAPCAQTKRTTAVRRAGPCAGAERPQTAELVAAGTSRVWR
jgi:hypothetical protein